MTCASTLTGQFVLSKTLDGGLFRTQNLVLGLAVSCLAILVVLPVGSLLLSSFWGESGFTLEYFREAFSSRLYLMPLVNSLVLGAWTGLFSILIGLPLAWAVARTNMPGKKLVTVTAALSYLAPPFLTSIAFVNLFSPNAGILNVLFRDVLGLTWLTFNGIGCI